MGWTNPTFRDQLRRFEEQWQPFRRALRAPVAGPTTPFLPYGKVDCRLLGAHHEAVFKAEIDKLQSYLSQSHSMRPAPV